MAVVKKKQLQKKRAQVNDMEQKNNEIEKSEEQKDNGTDMQDAVRRAVMSIPVIGNVAGAFQALMEMEKKMPVLKNHMKNLMERIKEIASTNSGKAVTGAKRVGNQSVISQSIWMEKYEGKRVYLEGKPADPWISRIMAENSDLPRYRERNPLPESWHPPMELPQPEIPVMSENEEINKKWKEFIQKQRAPQCYVEIEQKKRIFIRLGHDVTNTGGFTGAYHEKLKERIVSDEVGLSLARELYKMGYEIKVYRSKDGTFGGKYVAALAANAGISAAAKWEADYFISCHANSLDKTLVNVEKYYGTEILYNKNTTDSSHACQILNTIRNSLSVYREEAIERISEEKGLSPEKYKNMLIEVKRARPGNVNEMTKTAMPAVLLEPVFISNSIDRAAYFACGGERLGIEIAKCVDSFLYPPQKRGRYIFLEEGIQ